MSEKLDIFGQDFFGEPAQPESRGAVSDRFVASPFTVIDARQGWWQDRKRAWVALGIKSEEGRDGMGKCMKPGALSLSEQYKQKEAEKKGLIFSKSSGTQYYYQKTAMEEKLGRKMTTAEFDPHYIPDSAADGGTSIFDPVLTECLYRWFAPPGGQIIDPFAGGSVRGIVAQKLGFNYWGSELRPEQVQSNEGQAEAIFGFEDQPQWWCGDALQADPPPGDAMIMCPPYGDLEVYSDLKEDISNMDHQKFLAAYRQIIARFCKALKNDTFACAVVGDFRDKKTGLLRRFVDQTNEAFYMAGLELYNDAILVTMVGSASLRVTKQFNSGKKLCRTHQNIQIYVKGDWEKAAKAITGN